MTKRAKEKENTSQAAAADAEQTPPVDTDDATPPAEEKPSAAVDIDQARQTISEKLDDEEGAEDVLSTVEALADRASELETIQAELNETKDQLMRQAASFQNYRRRTQQEKKETSQRARSQVVAQLLDVLDDFDRSLEATQQVDEQDEPDYEAAYHALKEGVELVYNKFWGELDRLGMEAIEAIGQPFDESEHEAMMQQPAPEDVAPGTVLAEVRKGYRLDDRVLRHSRVIVAGEPQEADTEAP